MVLQKLKFAIYTPKVWRNRLEMETPESELEVDLADASRNPSDNQVKYWYSQFKEARYGSNPEGVFRCLEEKQKLLAQSGTLMAISQEPFGVAILTPIMQRHHEERNWSGRQRSQGHGQTGPHAPLPGKTVVISRFYLLCWTFRRFSTHRVWPWPERNSSAPSRKLIACNTQRGHP